MLEATLGDNAFLYATETKMAALSKAGQGIIDDDSQSNRPTSALTNESMKDVEKFVVKDRHVSV